MSSLQKYNYIIVGGGPSGLVLSYLLGRNNHKCLVIDSNPSLGGCHRVYRVNGLFTEHSPRIYSSTYVNTISILKLMGSSFHSLFTPYNFSIANIGGNVLSHLTHRELGLLTLQFFRLTFNQTYGANESMMAFMMSHNFTNDAIDYIDRLCRLSDGCDSTKYSLNKFLQIVNQQSLYTIYQPKLPTDKGLISIIEKACKDTGNVDFMLSTSVTTLVLTEGSNNILSCTTDTNQTIYGDAFVLAIPPKPLIQLLQRSNLQYTFDNLDYLSNWSKESSYNNYVSITYHWNTKLDLPKIWGFPKTEWGVAFIVLSDYMTFDDDRSKTVISSCITIFDKPFKGLLPNQVDNEQQLKQLVYEQLKQSFPNLPEPSISLLSPLVSRIDGKWIEKDTGFVKTFDNSYLPFDSEYNENLYNLGTQNGFSSYKFTSLESAVTNAIELAYILDPKVRNDVSISSSKTLVDCLRVIYVIVCILIIFQIIKYLKKLK